jgi:hypothetical protein
LPRSGFSFSEHFWTCPARASYKKNIFTFALLGQIIQKTFLHLFGLKKISFIKETSPRLNNQILKNKFLR